MQPLHIIESPTVALNFRNIDTDQIIPARFLKETTRAGLGRHLFSGWRYLPDGSENPSFPLNQAQGRSAAILLAGDNFGCGSSREHAPWALVDYGIRAVISTSHADIFRNNALKNGLLPISVNASTYDALLAQAGARLCIDLQKQTMTPECGTPIPFAIDPFSRFCLLQGLDELDYLLQQEPLIQDYERKHHESTNCSTAG
jgi:3-isopropylmalate/(R)-2-methylmalate dehydratase small subunit